jgi:hypothetical protein
MGQSLFNGSINDILLFILLLLRSNLASDQRLFLKIRGSLTILNRLSGSYLDSLIIHIFITMSETDIMENAE